MSHQSYQSHQLHQLHQLHEVMNVAESLHSARHRKLEHEILKLDMTPGLILARETAVLDIDRLRKILDDVAKKHD